MVRPHLHPTQLKPPLWFHCICFISRLVGMIQCLPACTCTDPRGGPVQPGPQASASLCILSTPLFCRTDPPGDGHLPARGQRQRDGGVDRERGHQREGGKAAAAAAFQTLMLDPHADWPTEETFQRKPPVGCCKLASPLVPTRAAR